MNVYLSQNKINENFFTQLFVELLTSRLIVFRHHFIFQMFDTFPRHLNIQFNITHRIHSIPVFRAIMEKILSKAT